MSMSEPSWFASAYPPAMRKAYVEKHGRYLAAIKERLQPATVEEMQDAQIIDELVLHLNVLLTWKRRSFVVFVACLVVFVVYAGFLVALPATDGSFVADVGAWVSTAVMFLVALLAQCMRDRYVRPLEEYVRERSSARRRELQLEATTSSSVDLL